MKASDDAAAIAAATMAAAIIRNRKVDFDTRGASPSLMAKEAVEIYADILDRMTERKTPSNPGSMEIF